MQIYHLNDRKKITGDKHFNLPTHGNMQKLYIFVFLIVLV